MYQNFFFALSILLMFLKMAPAPNFGVFLDFGHPFLTEVDFRINLIHALCTYTTGQIIVFKQVSMKIELKFVKMVSPQVKLKVLKCFETFRKILN